ncbi:MAG: hypothetical protein PHT91_01315 [Candidatus Nanoarchaeia archaeon]|nr:hypothetical protein [Candidatus Nanoarchaeia archaeon]MDD5054104.1 hypothetical protein [Candidatus Nanoarchaeia archaeon]MDD5499496.1 hypothetical protein [Candidatus Nanoarchaeia archaeon]
MKDFEIRQYNIRLKKDGLKAPQTERSKRAIVTIKKFIEKNTRAKRGNVLIGEELNNELWGKGIRNPPAKVSIFAQKLKGERVFVNLQGKPLKIETETKEEKKKAKKEKKLEQESKEKEAEKEENEKIKETPSAPEKAKPKK